MNAQYLIIGSGKTATHFSRYFSLLGLSFTCWNRQDSITAFKAQLQHSTHIILAISDPAIEPFFNDNLQNYSGVSIHLSGSLNLPRVKACHPLMTFGATLYDLATYKSIPFVLDRNEDLAALLPGLPNSFYTIDAKQRALYHALCVVGGNFTTLLWSEMSKGFASIGLSAEIAKPYLKQVLENFLSVGVDSLTGPLARKDIQTVERNIEALSGSSSGLADIYTAFAKAYLPQAKPNSNLAKIRRRA